MDFLLMEEFLAVLHSRVPNKVVEELPRFLASGLRQYLTFIRSVPFNPDLNLEPALSQVTHSFA